MIALTLDVYHWILEFFQNYTNDDLWLTLTFLIARSNMGNAGALDFKESFEDFGLKIMGIQSCFNEYKRICKYKRSRSFFDI